MKNPFRPFRREEKEVEVVFKFDYKRFTKDWDKLIECPISLDALREQYKHNDIPVEKQVSDLLLLLHLHREELAKLKKELGRNQT